MLDLKASPATFSNLNTRIERHGDERVLAADAKFEVAASNEILDSIDPSLRGDFFRKPGKGEQQDLPIDAKHALTAVKHPALSGPHKLSTEFEGAVLTIAGELDMTDPLVLHDVKVKKLEFDTVEGGSVHLRFTASANIDADELAELSQFLVRENVVVTLTPAEKAHEALDEAA